jgi:hypothetical protein
MDVHAQKKDTAARALVPMLIDSSAGSGSSMEEQKGINGDGHRDLLPVLKKEPISFSQADIINEVNRNR